MVMGFKYRKRLVVVVLVMVIAAAIASAYLAYEMSRPPICTCPAGSWVGLIVYEGNKTLLNETLAAGPPCPCAGLRGWVPPVFMPLQPPLSEQHCVNLTGIAPPVGVANFTCYIINGASQFIIPTSVFTSPSGLVSAMALINGFLNYNRLSLDKAFNGTVELLMGIPPVREYVGNGVLTPASEGFIMSTTRVGNYLVINVVGVEYVINVIAPNGTRIGIIHVKYYPLEPMGGIERIEVTLMPRSMVQEINKIRLTNQTETTVSWAGYVVYYNNYSLSDVSAYLYVPPGISGGSNTAVAVWVGYGPSYNYLVPYIQAGYMWEGSGPTIIIWYTGTAFNYEPQVLAEGSYSQYEGYYIYSYISSPSFTNNGNTELWNVCYEVVNQQGNGQGQCVTVTISNNFNGYSTYFPYAQYIVESPSQGEVPVPSFPPIGLYNCYVNSIGDLGTFNWNSQGFLAYVLSFYNNYGQTACPTEYYYYGTSSWIDSGFQVYEGCLGITS